MVFGMEGEMNMKMPGEFTEMQTHEVLNRGGSEELFDSKIGVICGMASSAIGTAVCGGFAISEAIKYTHNLEKFHSAIDSLSYSDIMAKRGSANYQKEANKCRSAAKIAGVCAGISAAGMIASVAAYYCLDN